MKSIVLNVGGVVVALLLLAGMYVGLVVPAQRDADDALVQARIALETAGARKAEIAGDRYRRDLVQVRDLAAAHLRHALEELGGHRARLQAWFPGLEIQEGGLPAWDEFGSAYLFAQDRLREDINARVREVSRIDVQPIPLRKPLFQAQDRDPRQEEMRREQRHFNIERLLLSSAARAGAFPIEPVTIDEEWKASEGSKSFHSTRVRLRLRLVPGQLSALLRSLLVLGGEGPTVRLAGIDARPSPIPERPGPDDPLTIDTTLDLDLVVHGGAS